MHYTSFFICFVAVFLCFAAHRTDGLPSSEHDTGARFALAVTEGNQLIQLLENCDQSLDRVAITTNGNCTSVAPEYPEICKKLTALLQKLLNSHHSVVPRSIPDINQIPIGPGPQYGLENTVSETARGEVRVERNSLVARTYDSIRRAADRNRRREVCEAKACPKKGLEKSCTAKKLQPKMAATCKMCYPTPNPTLIGAHCQARWKRERRAFYVVCFVLIGITLVSGLALRLRRAYAQKRQQTQTEEDKQQTGELYHYDGAKSSKSYDGAKSSTSVRQSCQTDGPSSSIDQDEQLEELWEEDEGDIGSSTAHKKWKQMGLLSKHGRKKVQDLFDLEAMRSRREVGNPPRQQPGDKIPVMPRAPNATVRQMNQGSRRGRLYRQSSQVELRQAPYSGTP